MERLGNQPVNNRIMHQTICVAREVDLKTEVQ